MWHYPSPFFVSDSLNAIDPGSRRINAGRAKDPAICSAYKRPQNKRMQGTLTPYEPIEATVKIGVSMNVKRLLRGAPDPCRCAAM